MAESKPYVWIIDSARKPLAGCADLFEGWADCAYLESVDAAGSETGVPDAFFVSGDLPGGPSGEAFARLVAAAEGIPVIVAATIRSLAQALAFFRAGAADYLPLPLEEREIQERLAAAFGRMERLAAAPILVELEQVDSDPGDVSLSVVAGTDASAAGLDDTDILAGIEPPSSPAWKDDVDAPEEPEPVDGLPIPTLWEELPCGLLVFDSLGNLVFSNGLGIELFGYESIAELQDSLDNRLSSFAAHAANHKPLPDNQWPHVLARKSRTARSAVISLEKPDKRRVWLRIDCLPHLSDGKVTRLSMTMVNLTGELPPLIPVQSRPPAPVRSKRSRKDRRRK